MPKLRSLGVRWRKLTGPAPMDDFSNYDEYWDKRGDLTVIYRRWQVAAEQIKDNASVLDVGCGGGEFLEYLQSVRRDLTVSGVDLSAQAVAKARAKGIDAHVVDIGSEDLPGQHDYVTCFEVLEHIPDAEAALLRLRHAFSRQLIISVPNVGYIGSRIRLAVFGRFPVTNCVLHIKEHVRHWTPRDFREWVAHFGLRLVRQEGQYGITGMPWRRWPSLFAQGMIYALEHASSVGRPPATAPASAAP